MSFSIPLVQFDSLRHKNIYLRIGNTFCLLLKSYGVWKNKSKTERSHLVSLYDPLDTKSNCEHLCQFLTKKSWIAMLLMQAMCGRSFIMVVCVFTSFQRRQVTLTTFVAFVVSDRTNQMTAADAFVSLAYFNILRSPLNTFATMIVTTIQVKWCDIREITRYRKISHHPWNNRMQGEKTWRNPIFLPNICTILMWKLLFTSIHEYGQYKTITFYREREKSNEITWGALNNNFD